MRTAGILGGIGPESTIAYYRGVIAEYRHRTRTNGAPSLLINSIDLERVLRLIETHRLREVTAYLAGELARLQGAGASFGVSLWCVRRRTPKTSRR